MQRLHDFLLVYAYPANLREDQDLNSIKKLPQTIIYAARINDRDVLRSSSSGGLFTVLSDPFLRCGGAIVCSVYQYDSHRIEFCLITEKSKRDCAKGSKYIQSSMGDIFRKAHEWLMEDAGRKLLFVGTGCQAEGFRKYAEQTGIRQRCTVVGLFWMQEMEFILEKMLICPVEYGFGHFSIM